MLKKHAIIIVFVGANYWVDSLAFEMMLADIQCQFSNPEPSLVMWTETSGILVFDWGIRFFS